MGDKALSPRASRAEQSLFGDAALAFQEDDVAREGRRSKGYFLHSDRPTVAWNNGNPDNLLSKGTRALQSSINTTVVCANLLCCYTLASLSLIKMNFNHFHSPLMHSLPPSGPSAPFHVSSDMAGFFTSPACWLLSSAAIN